MFRDTFWINGSSTVGFHNASTTISIFFYKAALAQQNASSGELLIPAFLNAVQVGVYGVVYQYIATVLTEFEVLHSYSQLKDINI